MVEKIVGKLARESVCEKHETCAALLCLIHRAVNEFRTAAEGKSENELKEIRDNGYLDELADSYCPVYNDEIMRYGAENITELALDEPEAFAFDGKKTALNALAGNIVDKISQALYEEYDQIIEGLEHDDSAD